MYSPTETDFLNKITSIIEENIPNEQFGVAELADKMSMSRSNLLRKVKKVSNLSVSQLISQVRLNRSMDLLRTSTLNVSEVSQRVGFSSTSYFIKCFREYFGYPPGEVGKREAEGNIPKPATPPPVAPGSYKKRNILGVAILGIVVALAVGLLMYYKRPSVTSKLEKSIAVLPFKNESSDSTNVYLINGLMESTLTNLSQIKNLKVISRSSVEKYRNTSKSIPEMARELNVNYLVEGSGQKIGDKILLNIQLIEASTDKHLWANQYRREANDIFALQQEIAKNIAEEIQVIITPEDEKKIEKIPTDNVVAYDFFLKGKDLFYQSTGESLTASIPYFKNAIELDNEFALAYANAVMVYFYLDMFSAEKRYTKEIDDYAGKAMTFDPKSGESLIAKGLSHAYKKEYGRAAPYLEKALEYNPGSGLVIHFLTEFYHMYVPNTRKYVEYALEGARLDNPSSDSTTASFKYFHLANALIMSGFRDEAELYINKSLTFNPKNGFAHSVKGFIEFVDKRDVKQARDRLTKEFKKDSTRFGIIQQLGQLSYFLRDYKSAYFYYDRLLKMKQAMRLDVYEDRNLEIGFVFTKMGYTEKGEELVERYKNYADNNQTIYKHLLLAFYECHRGQTNKALEELKLFSKEDNYVYLVLLMEMDPILDPIKNLPEFKKIMRDLEKKFWETNKEIKEKMLRKGMP